ncbi:MAG: Mov34/MPN/PAD-1 family protein [Proteobacteria bacterium]|nr:Mov34/MPN/PAD-1 family protein [Pseudomonadota bacterium]MBU4472516.1 Mov34/MPN/PAD-1 family protein [Pseudomonadota bacterium]MCG2751340.1 Mov34/MPN/PAD-1 family protein [Desulfobacteraceae bacterium]
MPVAYVPFGVPYQGLNPDKLTMEISRRTLSACIRNDSFEVLELRRIIHSDGELSDVIVVECINDQVPSRNDVGIKVREHLALVFHQGKIPEVRALRVDFPKVMHLNHVPSTEPLSICLYFQPWSALERSWTPQKHLQRILWWLSETAKKTLHRVDQPLENIFFDSPFEIVLPPNYAEKILLPHLYLSFTAIDRGNNEFRVIRGEFVPKEQAKKHGLHQIEIFDISLPPVVNERVDITPNTLGGLNDTYQRRGVQFFDSMVSVVKEKAKKGLIQDQTQKCLFILRVPLARAQGEEPEKVEVRAFLLLIDIVALGVATGSLIRPPESKMYYANYNLGAGGSPSQHEWMHLEIMPIELREEVDISRARQLSGVSDENSNIECTLMGVGALGSAIAELTSKSGWGVWTYIDPDIVKTHNIVRHISKNCHIGLFKTDAVKNVVAANYHGADYSPSTINDSAINFTNEKVMAALTASSLNIDATTTLEVPREISQIDAISRSASAFVAPSGRDAVLIVEDEERNIRLDAIEPQYYRAVLNSDWGSQHLTGHKGSLWVGAGCRDVSAIISFEGIQLAAAILSKQIRVLKNLPTAAIKVWTRNGSDSSVVSQEIAVSPSSKTASGGWVVVLDKYIKQQLNALRLEQLPRETGGIIVGYIDQKLKTIYVVDVLPAPYDSEADYSGFTRGVAGLNDALNEISDQTANIVGYIGEWHSHPEFASANPSSLDWRLIEKLSGVMAIDDQPVLMLIVGINGDISITVRYQS